MEEYKTLCTNHPAMLKDIILNVSGMIASRQNSVMDMNMDSSDDESKADDKDGADRSDSKK